MNTRGMTATCIITTGGVISLYYHSTAVCRHNVATGTIILDSGGWRTPTTKRRINDYLQDAGFRTMVHQVRGTWWVRNLDTDAVYEFFDGISIARDGEVK